MGRGRGAEFVVHLAAARGAAAEGKDRTAARVGLSRGRPARVLVVEDNVDAADALAILLELLGHHVDTVHDGLAALEALAVGLPDVMIVDIGLPGIDGFEVARRVRRLPGDADLRPVALTGHGRADDVTQARAAAFDHHLTKPVEIDALERLVLRPERATEGPSSPSVH